MQAACLGCRQMIEVDDIQPAKILNYTSCSLVLVEHPKQTMCPNCKIHVSLGVLNVNLVLAAGPVVQEEQRPIILAPDGSDSNKFKM